MKARKKTTHGFPKQVYVFREKAVGQHEPYLLVESELPNAEDGQPIAIYELREVKTLRVTRALDE